jgi:hypothetical protein
MGARKRNQVPQSLIPKPDTAPHHRSDNHWKHNDKGRAARDARLSPVFTCFSIGMRKVFAAKLQWEAEARTFRGRRQRDGRQGDADGSTPEANARIVRLATCRVN